MSPLGILLVNLGTPDAPTAPAIRRYLAEFLADPRLVNIPRLLWLPVLYGLILPFRPAKLIAKYENIWHEAGAPIRYITAALAHKTQLALGRKHLNRQVIVTPAMTYGNPSIKSGIEALQQAEVKDILLLPLFPQYSASTSAACLDKFCKVAANFRYLPSFRFISDYHLEPRYIAAIVQSIRKNNASAVGSAEGMEAGEAAHLLFSFHGLPQAQADAGDPYPQQCHATARAIAAQLGLRQDQYDVAFQSRFGRAAWLQPYSEEILSSLPARGKRHLTLICPGFAADCLETLEDIEVANRSIFEAAGGRSFHYIEALNASDAHVNLIEGLILDTYPNLAS